MIDVKLVIFDMDGVIFEGNNFWLELHRAYGTEKQGLELAKRHLSSDYDHLAYITARRLWKGRSAVVYEQLIDQRRYQPGVRELFSFLHDNHIRSAIISSGPYELALRAQKDLGIDEIRANRLGIEDGVLSGDVEIMVPDTAKDRIGLQIMAQMGAEAQDVVFIGDADPDVRLAQIVGLPIAYNSKSENLNKVCRYILQYGELGKVVHIICKEQRYGNYVVSGSSSINDIRSSYMLDGL